MPVTPLDRASAARVAALPSQAVSSQPFAELLHSKQTRIGLKRLWYEQPLACFKKVASRLFCAVVVLSRIYKNLTQLRSKVGYGNQKTATSQIHY
jgi:hypothetical protein